MNALASAARRRADLRLLVGDVDEEGRRAERQILDPEEKLSLSSRNSTENGVTVQWLAKTFRMTRHMVEKKIRHIRPISEGRHGQPLYDIPEAAGWLVDAKIDMDTFMKTVKMEDLPEKLRDSYWSGKLKRQRYEERAGDLWHTEEMMAFFSKILSDLRDDLQMTPELVERLHGCTPEQYQTIRNAMDSVQENLYEKTVALASKSLIKNQLRSEKIDRDEDDLI